MTTTDTDALTERITEKVRQALDAGEAMQCTRVWEAWHYGTMTDADFADASDGLLAEEIAAAVLTTILDHLAAAERRIRDLTQEVRDERGAARDQMEQVRIRDARIKAVRDALDGYGKPTDRIGGLPDAIRRALESVPPPGQ